MIRLEITDPATGTVYVPHLPADLSFEMLRENPLFNRRGDYTYDIDISLRDPHNRAIYQHIDRLTASSRPQNRRARLLCDGHVVADGTEVILKKEGERVKIQIVAGNSEMNYLIADENLRIREMDFGKIPKPSINTVERVMNLSYPDANYAFPTIYKGTDTSYDEDSSLNPGIFDNEYYYGNGEMHYSDSSELWPQPYLLYYVEKFIRILGYTIRRNDLRNTKWCRLMLISGYKTLEYAKMLPDWTAAEFLEEMEKFFNIIIVVDQITKTADIINLTQWYNETAPVEIDDANICDEFEADYEPSENQFHNNYVNIAYKLPSGKYWKFASIDKDIMRRCEVITATTHQAAQMEDVSWKIFYEPGHDFYFIRYKEGGSNYTILVNMFAPYIENEEVGTTTFRIIPAEIYFSEVTAWGNYLSEMNAAMPQFYENEVDSEEFTFYDAIEQGIKDVAGDVIQVAFYAGMLGNSVYRRPFQFTIPKAFHLGLIEVTEQILPGASSMTLEPRKRYAQDFKNSYRVGKEAYTASFRAAAILDPMRQFLIHNRLFVCQQLKYTYKDGHQHPIVEGVFYPYNNN